MAFTCPSEMNPRIHPRRARPAGILLAALFAAAGTAVAQEHSTVEIRFRATVGDRPLTCGERYTDLGAAKSGATLADFRLFVSNVELLRGDGQAAPVALEQDGIWQYKNLALLDFEDGTGSCNIGTKPTRTLVRGTVPRADYRGLRFTLGVPPDLNHADPTIAPSPLNLTAMFWSWQAGYKFLKLDLAPIEGGGRVGQNMRPTADTRAVGFSFHMGSTGCMGGSRTGDAPKCAQANRVVVTLPKFDVATNVVTADVGALIARTELDRNAPNTSPGCMSFPGDADCDHVMTRLGLSYGTLSAEPQVLFSVR